MQNKKSGDYKPKTHTNPSGTLRKHKGRKTYILDGRTIRVYSRAVSPTFGTGKEQCKMNCELEGPPKIETYPSHEKARAIFENIERRK